MSRPRPQHLTPWLAMGLACLTATCSDAPGDEASATTAQPDGHLAAGDLADAVGDAVSDTSAAPEADASVDPPDGEALADVATQDAAGAGPPYPIVLAHGFFGFEAFAGLKFASYFYGVRDDLAKNGEAQVFTPAVDPFNSSTARGAQLLAHIEAILAQTGHAKVNIIGHSQGGLDARVVAHQRPDLVASVTTFATPHGGSPVADIAMKLLPNEKFEKLLDALAKLLGQALYDKVGEASSVVAGIKQFTEAEVALFNAAYPDSVEIDYHSLAGRSGNRLAPKSCTADVVLPFISKWKAQVDPIDPLLAIQESLLDGALGLQYPNDGMVRVVDARWGVFLGCVPADHLDEVGHLLGDKAGLFNPWDHKQFFRDLVAWLRDQGY